MEQHLHQQRSKRLLGLSNYTDSKVLDYSQGKGGGGSRAEDERGGGGGWGEKMEDLKTKNTQMKKWIFTLMHTHTSGARGNIKAARDTNSLHTHTHNSQHIFQDRLTLKKQSTIGWLCSHNRRGREDGPWRHMYSIMGVTTTCFIC